MVTVKPFLDAGFEFVPNGDALFVNGVNSGKHYFNIGDAEYILKHPSHYYDYVIADLAWRKNTGVQPVGDDCWVEVVSDDGIEVTKMAKNVPWKFTTENSVCGVAKWKPSLKHLEQQMNDNQETKTALEMSERDIENYADDCDVERELKEGDEVVWGGKGIPPVGCECDILDVNDKSLVIGFGSIYHVDEEKVLIISESISGYPDDSLITDFCDGKNLYAMYIYEGDVRFKKKETPEQKAAREREEAAIELHDLAQDAYFDGRDGTASWDKAPDRVKKMYYAIVDKTGYRK